MNWERTLSVCLGVILGLGLVGRAAGADLAETFSYDPQHATFSAQETSFDLFGAYTSHDRHGDEDSTWGVGARFNYFFTENLGMSLDTYTDGLRIPYMLNASAVYRFPLGSSAFAPYVFGGFGRQWKYEAQWTFHFGGGIEYRINESTGLFLDIRGVIPEDTENYEMIGFGVRFVF